jgi:protein SCO1
VYSRNASRIVGRLAARQTIVAWACCCVLISALPAANQVFAQAADTQPPQLRDIGIDQRLNEQMPLDPLFRDESGKTVRLGDYFGRKPVILTFAYYECPMLCTLVLNGLVKGMRTLPFDVGKQFEVVNISINPREGPKLAAAKKNTYIREYGRPGAAEGWHFLTGEESEIKRATEAAGFRYKYDTSSAQYIHASGIMILTPKGKFARYFYGIEYAGQDLRLGLIEAAEEKIGSPVDQVLLYCFHYDPVTGKYGLAINAIIRILGTATVLALGSFMLIMFRRDRRLKMSA